MQNTLREALDRQKGKTTIAMPDALDLIRKYFAVEAFESFQPLALALMDEDDRRRYVIEKDIPVKTPDGATVCAFWSFVPAQKIVFRRCSTLPSTQTRTKKRTRHG